MQLHHIALGARDVDGVAEFYREVFGLTEIKRHHYDDGAGLRSVWLDTGGCVLMVEHTLEPIASETAFVNGVNAGPFLLAFAVDEEDLEGIERALHAFGREIESRSSYTSYARDPEGNRVAISHAPLRSL